MSDNAMYSIDCAMFLSEETKGPSFSTKDKRVAITFPENDRLNLKNQYHKKNIHR